MISRLDRRNDGAKLPYSKSATEPEPDNIGRNSESGGIPSISSNPVGVLSRGSVVLVREDDLAALVYAAREVAFGMAVPLPIEDADRVNKLDKASEAFADSFPWHDTPAEDCGPLKVGQTVDLPGSSTQRFTALVSESRDLIVHATGKFGANAMILPAVTVRALALVERRIP